MSHTFSGLVTEWNKPVETESGQITVIAMGNIYSRILLAK